MRQFKIDSFIGNRNFNTNMNKRSDNFKVSLQKVGCNINVTNFSDSKTINTTANLNSSTSSMSTSMDTQGGTIDEYYDEIIYYDGGGVEGYGY